MKKTWMQILDYEYIYIFAIQQFNPIVHNMKNQLFIAILIITLTGCWRSQAFLFYNKTNEPVKIYCHYDVHNHIDSVYIPQAGRSYLLFLAVKLKQKKVAKSYLNHMDSVILKLPNREIVYKDSLSIYNFFYMRDTSVIKSVPEEEALNEM